MSRRRPLFSIHLRAIAITIRSALVSAQSTVISALRSRRTISVEVVITDASRRRATAREIRRALQQLRRTLGSDLPNDLTVVVQQTVVTDQPLVGCVQSRQRADGTRVHLIRLALQFEGRRLSIDDVLAALTDACVGIVVQSATLSVLVPLGMAVPQTNPTTPPPVVRPDPLAPRPNGSISRGQVP